MLEVDLMLSIRGLQGICSGWLWTLLQAGQRLYLEEGRQYVGRAGRMDMKDRCMLSCFSRVRLFVMLWTVAHQAPPPMGFPRQEYWSGVPLPSPKIFAVEKNEVFNNQLFIVHVTDSDDLCSCTV